MPLKAVVLRVVAAGLAAWLATEWWTGRWRGPEPTGVAVLGFAGVTLLAGVFSHAPRLAWAGEVAQREGTLTVLSLAVLHVAASHAHRSAADARATLRVLLWSAVAAAVYAQLQVAGLDPIAWSGAHTIETGAGAALRPAGPLGSPVLLGIVIAVAIPLVLADLAEARNDAAWGIPMAALLAATLLLTLSRGAWLAGLVGAAAAVVLALLAGARPLRVLWTVGVSVSPALVLAFGRASAPVAARLGESLETGSAATRTLIARGALQLWSERPWLGHGPDSFGLMFPHVQEPAFWRQEWIGAPVHAHSVPLQTLATTGALGALAGFAWLAVSAWALWRAWQQAPQQRPWLAGLMGAFIALCAAGMINVTGLSGAAMLAVLTALPGAAVGRAPLATLPVRRRLSARAPLAIAGVIAAAELLTASYELRALALANVARGAERGDRTPSEWRALTESQARALESATDLWAHDDLVWRLSAAGALQAASAAESTDAVRWRERAEHAARRAIAITAERAPAWASLGDALAARALANHDVALADSTERAYSHAERLAPSDGWLLVAHARFALARRDGVRALVVAQRLSGLYPEAALGHTLAGTALLLLERPGEARAAFQQALAARWESDAATQRSAVEALVKRLPARVPAASAAGSTGPSRPRR